MVTAKIETSTDSFSKILNSFSETVRGMDEEECRIHLPHYIVTDVSSWDRKDKNYPIYLLFKIGSDHFYFRLCVAL